MAFIKPTIIDFKNYFPRDFRYFPEVWEDTIIYNIDDQVYYATTQLFYKCKNNNVSSVPTTTTDWDILTINILNYVQDTDISKAMAEVDIHINIGLFSSQNTYIFAYLYLTAHFLCLNLQGEKKGINSSFDWLLNSKAVADVSGSYAIPEVFTKSFVWSSYVKTYYGLRYADITYPLTRAKSNFIVLGGTTV